MTRGFISSIHKKGDKKQCSNYRGICVTNSIMKVLGKIISNRVEGEYKTSEEQCGFTAGKSGVDHLFTIRQLLQKSHEKMKDIHMIFIDLEKAYDSVPRKLMWKTMETANISRPIISLIRLIYKSNMCQIKMGSKLSEEFRTSKVLLQGYCMSPTLFKIYIDTILND